MEPEGASSCSEESPTGP